MVLLDFMGLVAVTVIGGLIVRWFSNSDQRRDRKTAVADIKRLTLRYNVACKGLRAIANGAGNPTIEAQATLDEIEELYTKELS